MSWFKNLIATKVLAMQGDREIRAEGALRSFPNDILYEGLINSGRLLTHVDWFPGRLDLDELTMGIDAYPLFNDSVLTSGELSGLDAASAFWDDTLQKWVFDQPRQISVTASDINTNDPRIAYIEISGTDQFGTEISERVPLVVGTNLSSTVFAECTMYAEVGESSDGGIEITPAAHGFSRPPVQVLEKLTKVTLDDHYLASSGLGDPYHEATPVTLTSSISATQTTVSISSNPHSPTSFFAAHTMAVISNGSDKEIVQVVSTSSGTDLVIIRGRGADPARFWEKGSTLIGIPKTFVGSYEQSSRVGIVYQSRYY